MAASKLPVIGQVRTIQDAQRALENIRGWLSDHPLLSSNKETTVVKATESSSGGSQTVAAKVPLVIQNNIASLLYDSNYFVLNGINYLALKNTYLTLLSSANIDLSTTGLTVLYTVPAGKSCVLLFSPLIAGSPTGASQLNIGQASAPADFIPTNTLATTSIARSVFVLQPVPSITPQPGVSYPSGTIIKATVVTAAGGSTNLIQLFGYLF